MGIKERLPGFLKKFLWSGSTKAMSENTEKKIKAPKGMAGELNDLRAKFSQFLITRKKEAGLILERKNYKVTKNSNRLFRLEGKEKDGNEYSLLISTGSYLTSKDGKITGLVHLSEADFNRAIAYEHSSLRSIFSRVKQIDFDEASIPFIDQDKKIDWKEILDWGIFWQEQIFIRLSANNTALLLVSLDDSFSNLFEKISTKKQKKIIAEELFFLNQGVTSEEMNPHSKNKNMFDFDCALKDLKIIIENLREKREKES